MDARNLWGHGIPESSLKELVFGFLKSNSDQMYTPVEVRYNLSDVCLDGTAETEMEIMGNVTQVLYENQKMLFALESLVDEGKVEKRRFEVDSFEELAHGLPEEQRREAALLSKSP